MKKYVVIYLILITPVILWHGWLWMTASTAPRLTVFIVVDQLGADLAARQVEGFTPGGFARVMKNGAWFPRARIAHAHTETAVGHGSLTTGVHPAAHGIVANSWYVRETASTVGAFTSQDKLICGPDARGFSPAHLEADTLGDALHAATEGRAKIFSVTGKDRSAVALAGKRGTAFWYQGSAQGFATSAYYLDRCPDWVEAWHRRDTDTPTFDRYMNQAWTLSREPANENYAFPGDNIYPEGTTIEANMRVMEKSGFGRAFPHQLGAGAAYYNFITATPMLDELTADFALDLVRREGLGQDDTPDMLLVGFSANDYVLHNFGPSTRESEEILYRLDQTLERFFAGLDELVGADNILIMLSSDHGGPEYPAVYRERDGVDSAWIAKGDLLDAARAALADNGWPEEIVITVHMPYIHVDTDRIRAEGLDVTEILEVIAEAVEDVDGVEVVVPTSKPGDPAADDITRRVLNNQFAGRSGELYVVRARYWQRHDPSGPFDLVQHGSVWGYDSTIPIGFSGPGVEVATHGREDARNVDVYPTLARFLGLPADPTRPGRVLDEVFASGAN